MSAALQNYFRQLCGGDRGALALLERLPQPEKYAAHPLRLQVFPGGEAIDAVQVDTISWTLLAARNAGTQCWSRTENDLTGDGIYVSGELPAENGNWRPAGAELQLSWRLGVAHVTPTTLIFAGRMLLIKLNRF